MWNIIQTVTVISSFGSYQKENTNKQRSLCNNQTTKDPTLRGAQTDSDKDHHRYLTQRNKRPLSDKLLSLQHHSRIPLLPLPSLLPHREETMQTYTKLLPQWCYTRKPFSKSVFQKQEHERKSCYFSAWYVTHAWNMAANGRDCESGWDAQFVAISPRNQFLLVWVLLSVID